MPEGNIAIGLEGDARPILQTLSDIKNKAKTLFKGVDAKELSTAVKSVQADMKATERQIQRTEAALDALMNGQQTPESVKALGKELTDNEKHAERLQSQIDAIMSGTKTPESVKVLIEKIKEAELEAKQLTKQADSLGAVLAKNTDRSSRMRGRLDDTELTKLRAELSAVTDQEAAAIQRVDQLKAMLAGVRQNPQLIPEVEQYQMELNTVRERIEVVRQLMDSIKANPQLTDEYKRLQSTLSTLENQYDSLKTKENELGNVAEQNAVKQQLANNNIFTGLGKIEQRIIRLAKRVLFFSVITIGLRALRKQISALIKSDSQLSASLAQVKGNLATAFGDIWLTILPAIRTLVKWLAIATKYIAAFISWITGKSLKAGQQAFQAASDASKDTAKNTGKIGKAAKKAAKEAQRMLLPFDQMNVLSSDKADADNDAADSSGADAGAGIANMEYPKNLDKIIARFEKLKDLIVLIGIAFAAWKLAGLLNALTGISKLTAFAGIASLAFGIYLLVTAIQDIVKNGPNFYNIMRAIAGICLIVGGAALLMGASWAPIVIAIGLVALAFSYLYKHSKKFREFVDGIGRHIKKLVKKFKEIGKGIKQAFEEKGFIGVGEYIIKGIWKGIKKAIKGAFKWLKEHIFDPIVNGIKKLFGIESPAKETMPIGEMIIKGLFEGMLKPIKTVGTWIKKHVFKPIKDALFGNDSEGKEGFFVKIGTKFTDTKEAITKKWHSLTGNVKDKTAKMKASVKQKWKDIKKSWTDLTLNIKDKDANMKAKVPQTWNNIKTAWTNLTKNVKDKTQSMKAKVPQTWSNIKSSWISLTQNVKDKTASMRAKVGSKWNDLKTTWNNLMSHFKDKTANVKLKIGTTVQSAKDFVNDIIYKLNTKLGNLKWPSWVPGIGGNWVFSSADPIPYLAKGAVIPANREFLAVLGDQKHGTNIETPLQTMIDAFNTALQQNGMAGNTNDINVYLQGDAKQLFRVVRVEANNYTRSTGKAAFEL